MATAEKPFIKPVQYIPDTAPDQHKADDNRNVLCEILQCDFGDNSKYVMLKTVFCAIL